VEGAGKDLVMVCEQIPTAGHVSGMAQVAHTIGACSQNGFPVRAKRRNTDPIAKNENWLQRTTAVNFP
jgi:hypothetical protein